MFLKAEDTSLIPIQVLGPKRVTGLSAFMGTASGYLLEAIPLMDSQLLRIPARQVQAELLVNEGMSELVFRELLRIYSKITRDFAASLTAHLQVSFPAEENCPSHRSAKFLVSRNVASGEVTGVCQRSFACSAEEGNGCPLAAKPALQIQPIWKRSSN